MKLLHLEDDLGYATLLREIAEPLGFIVSVTKSFKETLKAWPDYDCIVADLVLPEGLEPEEIAEGLESTGLPLLFWSDLDCESRINACIRAVPVACLDKNTPLVELKENLLQLRRATKLFLTKKLYDPDSP